MDGREQRFCEVRRFLFSQHKLSPLRIRRAQLISPPESSAVQRESVPEESTDREGRDLFCSALDIDPPSQTPSHLLLGSRIGDDVESGSPQSCSTIIVSSPSASIRRGNRNPDLRSLAAPRTASAHGRARYLLLCSADLPTLSFARTALFFFLDASRRLVVALSLGPSPNVLTLLPAPDEPSS